MRRGICFWRAVIFSCCPHSCVPMNRHDLSTTGAAVLPGVFFKLCADTRGGDIYFSVTTTSTNACSLFPVCQLALNLVLAKRLSDLYAGWLRGRAENMSRLISVYPDLLEAGLIRDPRGDKLSSFYSRVCSTSVVTIATQHCRPCLAFLLSLLPGACTGNVSLDGWNHRVSTTTNTLFKPLNPASTHASSR